MRGIGRAAAAFVRRWLGGVVAAALGLAPAVAQASGGFFSGPQPVEQSAQRILFEVGADTLTMTVQLRFRGDAADFAWVLPLGEVPIEGSLAVFPQLALNALDDGSRPLVELPPDPECATCVVCPYAGVPALDAERLDDNGDVRVYVQQEVGEYTAAVIGSEDPDALVEWLRAQGYRISSAMEPYIALYTGQGLKFLALKLSNGARVNDLSPFRFSLPGTRPSIPLGLTALAAEPELSIVVFVLANTRFEGENWPNLEIASETLRFDPHSGSINWAERVAQAVDSAGGRGWITELAEPSASHAQRVQAWLDAGRFPTPEESAAARQLLSAFAAYPYLTRLSTRLSPEEMVVDPVLEPSGAGDVPRFRPLPRFVGIDACDDEAPSTIDPCEFATCGASGLCRVARSPAAPATPGSEVAGCACLPGAAARASLGPGGAPTVICQDGRLSFSSAGELDPVTGEPLPDACAGFDCGFDGRCMAINLTPTCVCDQGLIAVPDGDTPGSRRLRCVEPSVELPADFYSGRLPELPLELPGGRGLPRSPSAAFPMPREVPVAAVSAYGGGCALGARQPPAPRWLAAPLLVLLGLLGLCRACGSRHSRPRANTAPDGPRGSGRPQGSGQAARPSPPSSGR